MALKYNLPTTVKPLYSTPLYNDNHATMMVLQFNILFHSLSCKGEFANDVNQEEGVSCQGVTLKREKRTVLCNFLGKIVLRKTKVSFFTFCPCIEKKHSIFILKKKGLKVPACHIAYNDP